MEKAKASYFAPIFKLLIVVALACLGVGVVSFAYGEEDSLGLDYASAEAEDRAYSWRYSGWLEEEGDDSAALEQPGASLFGAFEGLTGEAEDYWATWSKANGKDSYVIRANPTDPDRRILVSGTLGVGIDVSVHNSEPGGGVQGPIDWTAVKNDGISFVIIRCGYGSDYSSQDDRWFAQNYKGAKAAGLKIGVYLYSYAKQATGTGNSAESEAKHVLRVLKENGITPADLALPVYYDLEEYSQQALDKKVLGNMATTFCNTIQNAGYAVGIYANQDWFKNVLTDPVFDQAQMEKNGWSRWVARYSHGSTTSGVAGTDIWQFTSIGLVNGTPRKYCDVNFLYMNTAATPNGMVRWVNSNGAWYLKNYRGQGLTGWQRIGSAWYYMKPQTGAMATGWLNDGGRWFWLDPDGSMVKGWKYIGDCWYYFADNGAMKANEWVLDGGRWFWMGPGGAMTKGWAHIGDQWYYFLSNGEMDKNGWRTIDSKRYYLTVGGARATGWLLLAGQWYWLGNDGVMTTAWRHIGESWYYFAADGAMVKGAWLVDGGRAFWLDAGGAMATGWRSIEGFWYYFANDGVMAKSGWLKHDGGWYYLDPAGRATVGWKYLGASWYYFDDHGRATTSWKKIDKVWYYFDADGRATTGWQNLGGTWFYMNASGQVQTSWQFIDGSWFFFGPEGHMQTGWQYLGGSWFHFGFSGRMDTSRWIDGLYWVDSAGHMVKNAWVDAGRYYVGSDGKWVKTAKK